MFKKFAIGIGLAIGVQFAQAGFTVQAGLYESCSGYYVSPEARTPEIWIELSQCSNYIDSILMALKLPESVPVERDDGSKAMMICPRPDSLWKEDNSRVFKPSEFVESYLRYWDHENASFISGYLVSAENSIMKAFAPRYAPCLAAASS